MFILLVEDCLKLTFADGAKLLLDSDLGGYYKMQSKA
jgi:hypothetical protein